MPLVSCPECGKQISSAATVCPNCGLPSPSKNKDTDASLTPIQPIPPKADVSEHFPIIPIDAKDSFEAARQIMQQLNRVRAEGWMTGQAFAGKDGINQYHMEKATQKAILRFDLRPTIRRGVSFISLTVATMSAANPELTEQKIKQLEILSGQKVRKRTAPSSPRLKFVLLICFLVAFIALLAFLIASYGIGTIWHAIFG